MTLHAIVDFSNKLVRVVSKYLSVVDYKLFVIADALEWIELCLLYCVH